MARTSKRWLSVLLAVAMVMTMLPTAILAADEPATYTKVTEDLADWSGEYLIVCEEEGKIFDGSLSALDAVNNYRTAEITDGTIVGDYAAYQFTVAETAGGYTVKAANGYIDNPSNSNALKMTAEGAANTLKVNAEGGTDVISSGGAYLRFNANADQMRFRYYKSGSYLNQKAIALYKLEEASGADHVVINQAYGGGGNAGAEYKNDFIELYNPTGKDVDLTGWSVQYAAKTGTSWQVTELSGTIKARGFYLVQEAAGNGGTKDLPAPDAAGSIAMGAKEFKLALVNNAESIADMKDENVVDFLGVGAANEFEGTAAAALLSNTTAALRNKDGVDTDDNAADFSAAAPNPRNSAGGETPVDPDEPETVTIAEALAGANGTEFTVKGVVTLLDGKNIYIQDATGGIDLYFAAVPADIKLGDTVIGTGTRGANNALPELTGASYEASSGMELKAKATTIAALTEADICTYVRLSGVEVTEVYDNNGAYASPNVTVKDSNGDTIQLYKAVVGKTDGVNWDVQVGDVIDVKAAVGTYTGKDGAMTLQLRNTLAEEITEHTDSPLVDGGKVVIWNPANGKALSTVYNEFYNTGVDVQETADGKLTGFTAAEVWTVGVNADGTYTFSTADGKKFSMGASFSSTPLDDVNVDWNVLPAATEGCVYIQNAARKSYIEWYADKNNWSSYGNIGSNEALFAQKLYKVEGGIEVGGDLPAAGDTVVIYNLSSKGVLAGQDDNTDSPAILSAAAALGEDLTVDNGGRVFTVEKNGDYYRFVTEYDGYLCSNGTGNNAFYAKEASEDADWTLAEYNGGYTMESRTAKFNGQYSQFMEYYSDSYKTYSMNKVTDKDIYTFQCLPYAGETTEGVVNVPAVDFGEPANAFVGAEYVLTFSVDAVFGVKELNVTVNGETLAAVLADGVYTVTVPVEKVLGEALAVSVSGLDNKDVAFSGSVSIAVKDEPVISDVTPAAGYQTGDDKRPEISAMISNAGENAAVTMKVNGEAVNAVYADGKVSYTADADMADGRVTVEVSVKRADGKEAAKAWSFTIGKTEYQLYFGQLHSHTQYSDGSGTLETALDYLKNLPESANVDFTAFTDHSNYFDTTGSANPEGAMYDMSLASADSQKTWNSYKDTVAKFNASQSEKIALGGFEMTWSGGPGHMNTFNTPGIVSRNNKTLNNKTGDAGMQAYYALLSQPEGADAIAQFNHPGTTFGNFADFAYWNPVIDSRISLLEVGNGEGQIGAGGYFPSYEQYTMALDKGWHVAPTNNQDNHKGKWGNANDARDVILTDNFTEEGLYEAMQSMRMYATEDKNLELNYTINGQMMGSSLAEVPEKLNVQVTVSDPDSNDSISRVEVVVNSGKVAYTWDKAADLASGSLSCQLDPAYSYYFIRVTEGDGDIAVTAPIWVGATLKLGISKVECGTSTPVTDEALTLTTTLFNGETVPANVKSLTYTNGAEVLGTDTTGYELPASGTLDVAFQYTPAVAKVMSITVTALVEQDGKEFTFSQNITLDVRDASKLVYIGIDASHYNEYVAGNYKDSMGNFSQLAAGYSVRTVELHTSDDLIAATQNSKYKMLILTAPSRRLADAQNDPKTYSEAELNAIGEFNAKGGVVVLAGWSDNYENYPVIQNDPAIKHMAATQNEVLEALGSSLRISDDATYDDVRSAADGVDPWRLYFSTYNYENPLTENVEFDAEHPYDRLYTEVFSHYGGASIYAVDAAGKAVSELPAAVSPVVYGHSSTYSKDVDGDGLGGSDVPKYDGRLMIMASEQQEGKGMVVVSGAAFMSNFEVQATIGDSNAEKNYANYKICENLVQFVNPVTIDTIAEVQAQKDEGVKYTIEGVITSNASGYDKDTAFFDCIYLQDETAGINAFPVAGNYKIGDKVRITGTTSSYQGERQIAVTSITLVSEGHTVEPQEVTAEELNNGSVLGSLITLKGTVVSFAEENGLVQTILVKDAAGSIGRVFIDGYITTAEDVKDLEVGCNITVTGLASYDNTFNAPEGPFPRIRIRDRADVVCTAAQVKEETVVLNVYEDGKTDKPVSTVSFKVPHGSKLDLAEINEKSGLYNIYDEAMGDKFAGWFNDGGWNHYKATGLSDWAVDFDKLEVNGWTNLYCMVTNVKLENVIVKAVVDGDKANAETIWSGKAPKGANVLEFLDANVEVQEREGYKLDKWFIWDWYGHKFDANRTINGWTNVYVTYTKIPMVNVVVKAVFDGDKSTAKTLWSGKAPKGENLVEWLTANVVVPEEEGYTADTWYNWDWYGHKHNSTVTFNGWTNVYVNYISK